MGQTLGDFLKITSADDYFMINVRKNKEAIYFGYENEIPDDIKSLIITEIYIDWASEALGIRVCEKEE
jgi:hypothetical protein